MHELSVNQRKTLLKNPNVEKITEKQVIFTSKFKVKSVESFIGGLSAEEIFKSAKINTDFFKESYARLCIGKWKQSILRMGKNHLILKKEDLQK
jgi:hypothetical protein